MATNRIEDIQLLFTVRNMRYHGPTSSEKMNDLVSETAHDLANIIDQWNNRLTPLTSTLPNGSPTTTVDAFANGLDGKNMYVDHTAVAGAYFATTYSRPNTIYEQFNSIYSAIDSLQATLEEQLADTLPVAEQIAIADAGGLIAAAHVEGAIAEIMTAVNELETALDLSAVAQHYLPAIDDVYDIGSSSKRVRDIYLGPTSLNISATAAQAGGTARDYKLEIDSTNGSLLFKEGTTQVFGLSSTGQTLTVSGVAAAPGYAFENDLDTGILSPLANTIGFSTGGTERFRLDSTGLVCQTATDNIYAGTKYGFYNDANTYITHDTDRITMVSAGVFTLAASGYEVYVGFESGSDMALYVNSENDRPCVTLQGDGFGFGQILMEDDSENVVISLGGNNGTSFINNRLAVGAGSDPTADAVLDLDNAGNKGLRLPSLTTTQKNLLTTEGLLVYDSTLEKVYVRNSTTWVALH